MKVNQILGESEWENDPFSDETIASLQHKAAGLEHEAGFIIDKLQQWTKRRKGEIYVTLGMKETGAPIPTDVKKEMGKFVPFNLVLQDNALLAKVFLKKQDPEFVKAMRKLIDRHNEIINKKADLDGRAMAKKASDTK